MKRIIILVVLSMLLMCVTACSGAKDPTPMPNPEDNNSTVPTPDDNNSTVPNPDDNNPAISQSVYELLDGLIQKDYSNIKINIVTSTEFAQLHANYVLTQNNVTYSIEQLNMLPSDGNITNLPSNYKTTVTGSALIQNGQVIELDGNNITLPSYDELKGNFNFNAQNFGNVAVGTNSFEANVVSPSGFYGANVNLNNVKVRVEFSQTSINKITVSYQTSNATVQTVYLFEN